MPSIPLQSNRSFPFPDHFPFYGGLHSGEPTIPSVFLSARVSSSVSNLIPFRSVMSVFKAEQRGRKVNPIPENRGKKDWFEYWIKSIQQKHGNDDEDDPPCRLGSSGDEIDDERAERSIRQHRQRYYLSCAGGLASGHDWVGWTVEALQIDWMTPKIQVFPCLSCLDFAPDFFPTFNWFDINWELYWKSETLPLLPRLIFFEEGFR